MIKSFLKDRTFPDIQIVYSEESEVLETGGGIKKALPFFRDESFICVNADIFTDFDFTDLKLGLDINSLGKLYLLKTPSIIIPGISLSTVKVNSCPRVRPDLQTLPSLEFLFCLEII